MNYNTDNTSVRNNYFYGDPEYLDRFMSDCSARQNEIRTSRKRRYTSISTSGISNGANLQYIHAFLNSNGLSKFDEFNKPFCVNDGSIAKKDNSYMGTLMIIFAIGLITLAAITFTVMSAKTNSPELSKDEAMIMAIFPIAFGSASLGFIVFGFLGYYLHRKTCSMQVDAVCVEIYSRSSENSEGGPSQVYKPFYYLKHNGKGYILFSNAWSNINVPTIGQIVKDFYINPDNPFDYCRKMGIGLILFYCIFIITFGMVPIFMLLA